MIDVKFSKAEGLTKLGKIKGYSFDLPKSATSEKTKITVLYQN